MTLTTEPIDLRRRWLAISLATVVAQFAYWPVIASLGTTTEGERVVVWPLVAIGMGIVPFALLALAFLSRQPNPASATLKALGLFILVGPPLVVLLDPLVGMVAGLAAGGLGALQRDETVHRLSWRWIAVAVLTVYIVVLVLVAPDFALVSGAVLPFGVHGLVDQAAETR